MNNKEQIKDEIILTVKKAIGVNSYYTEDDNFLIDSNDIDHIAEQTAENLYNAGYRKTFTSDLASDTQKAFKEGYEKVKEEQTMIYLKFPPIEKIQGFKIYGNKHLKFWRNTVTKDDYIVVVLCGERVSFPATQDGVDKAEKWVNEKRAEIANALKL